MGQVVGCRLRLSYHCRLIDLSQPLWPCLCSKRSQIRQLAQPATKSKPKQVAPPRRTLSSHRSRGTRARTSRPARTLSTPRTTRPTNPSCNPWASRAATRPSLTWSRRRPTCARRSTARGATSERPLPKFHQAPSSSSNITSQSNKNMRNLSSSIMQIMPQINRHFPRWSKNSK